jgi:hypothetical protein
MWTCKSFKIAREVEIISGSRIYFDFYGKCNGITFAVEIDNSGYQKKSSKKSDLEK